MKVGGHFEALWEDKAFVALLIKIIFDEGHCISTWGNFRSEYRDVGSLRDNLPNVRFYVASATLSKALLDDICKILRLNEKRNDTEFFLRSNDRPNVFIGVHRMQFPASSFKDLDIIFPRDWKPGDPKPPSFLILFDSIPEAEGACEYLQSKLPIEIRYKIKWFHSRMTDKFRADEIVNFMNGDTWGLCASDSFGLVSEFQS